MCGTRLMITNIYRHFVALIVIALAGCVTSQPARKIEKVDHSLVYLQELVVSILPVGQRVVSPNAREFLSKYFVPKKNEYVEADTAPRRWFAHILILGDRR